MWSLTWSLSYEFCYRSDHQGSSGDCKSRKVKIRFTCGGHISLAWFSVNFVFCSWVVVPLPTGAAPPYTHSQYTSMVSGARKWYQKVTPAEAMVPALWCEKEQGQNQSRITWVLKTEAETICRFNIRSLISPRKRSCFHQLLGYFITDSFH